MSLEEIQQEKYKAYFDRDEAKKEITALTVKLNRIGAHLIEIGHSLQQYPHVSNAARLNELSVEAEKTNLLLAEASQKLAEAEAKCREFSI